MKKGLLSKSSLKSWRVNHVSNLMPKVQGHAAPGSWLRMPPCGLSAITTSQKVEAAQRPPLVGGPTWGVSGRQNITWLQKRVKRARTHESVV